MSDERRPSEAVRSALIKTAGHISKNGLWGNEELKVLSEATKRLADAYIDLKMQGE